MTPLPWLQFNTPQLGQRPSVAQSLLPLAQAGIQRMTQQQRSIEPPLRKYQTESPAQIARHAGNAANAELGPAPVMKRRFPNPQQQQQLDMMR